MFVSAAKPDLSPTRPPDTYVIINGVRQRVTDDVTGLRRQQSTAANQRGRNTVPMTYDRGITRPPTVVINHEFFAGGLHAADSYEQWRRKPAGIHTYIYTHTHLTAFFRDYPSKPIPER